MFYKVYFDVDTDFGLSRGHIAIVRADNFQEAIDKVAKEVESNLGEDEYIREIGVELIKNDDILHCDFREG